MLGINSIYLEAARFNTFLPFDTGPIRCRKQWWPGVCWCGDAVLEEETGQQRQRSAAHSDSHDRNCSRAHEQC